MPFQVEVFRPADYARAAAGRIAGELPSRGSVVITGGTTAAAMYPHLADAAPDWGELDVFFSDERCVPPDDERSNYRMANQQLLERVQPRSVHRILGEKDPSAAADAYRQALDPAVTHGFDLMVLGMGDDCHICALFPGSPALREKSAPCAVVDRPDGMKGITLTPPAVLGARRTFVIVAGQKKAQAVLRASHGAEDVTSCPVRLLEGARDVTFLVDEGAASAL
jgi:6-phosphogluconolactonase